MRRETDKIVTAFLAGKPAAAARTMTDGEAMFLHGHKIAWRDRHGRYYATLAGWPTATTRDRLNGLCRRLGVGGFYQQNFTQYYGENRISEWDVIQLTGDQ